MRRTLTQILLAALFVASTAFAASAQSARQKSDPPPAVASREPKIVQPPDTGNLKGGAYSNDFFGFSFMPPEGWFVLGDDDNKRVLDRGRQVVEGSAPEKKKAGLEASLARTSILFSTSKYEPGTPRPELNAMFVCVAERVPADLIKTGADYLSIGMRSFAGTAGAKLEIVGPVRTEKVGGVEFTVADFKLTVGSAVRTRRQYVRITKGHALILAYIYMDDADLKTFDELLGTVKFK